MKYKLFLLLTIIALPLFAADNNSLISYYKDGQFTSQHQTRIKTTAQIVSSTVDYLVSDFHNNPSNLFNWALKDMGLQEGGNEVVIIFVSSKNDTKTGITHGVFDIIVPNLKTFKNVEVDAIVTKEISKNGIIKATANIVYSSLLLKDGLGTITFFPQKNNEMLVVTELNINFGWFFNFFITKKRYKNIVEWRVAKFSENIILECKKKQEQLKKTSLK